MICPLSTWGQVDPWILVNYSQSPCKCNLPGRMDVSFSSLFAQVDVGFPNPIPAQSDSISIIHVDLLLSLLDFLFVGMDHS